MTTKLDELYEQKSELQRQLLILNSQINKEKKTIRQKQHENICEQYKQCFLKDIEIFNKENIEKEIKSGVEVKTPHYLIWFLQNDYSWKAKITDLHKSKHIVSVSLLKEDVKTIKQALTEIADTIVDYEFKKEFAGVG